MLLLLPCERRFRGWEHQWAAGRSLDLHYLGAQASRWLHSLPPSFILSLARWLGSSPSPTPILVQRPDQLRACGWWGQPGGGSVVWWTAPGGAGEKGQLLCPVRCASNRGTSRGRLTSSGPFKCEGGRAVMDSRESRCRDPEG